MQSHLEQEPKQLHIQAQQGDYDVLIGVHLLENAHRFLAPVLDPTASVMIVYDEALAKLGYVDRMVKGLAPMQSNVYTTAVQSGEASKSLACAEELYRAFIAAGLDRRSTIIALGAES